MFTARAVTVDSMFESILELTMRTLLPLAPQMG